MKIIKYSDIKSQVINNPLLFSYIFIPDKQKSFLIDNIDMKNGKTIIRSMESDHKTSQVFWFESNDTSWWGTVQNQSTLKLSSYPIIVSTKDPEIGKLNLKFENKKFRRLGLPLINIIDRFLPVPRTKGFTKVKGEIGNTIINNYMNITIYKTKDMNKNQWIYLAACNDNGESIELASSQTMGLKAATWHLKTYEREEFHSSPHNFSLVRSSNKFENDGKIIYNLILGKRKNVKINFSYHKDTVGELWRNQSHSIQTSLSGEIALELENRNFEKKWDLALIEINQDDLRPLFSK